MAPDRTLGTAVVTAAAVLFCAVLIFLALQVRAGRDPAIGAAEPAPRPVIVRRVIVRRVVEADRPVPRAPAAAPAPPAPAPAPAPVVSRGS
jgi:hypothetical protein